MIANPFTPQERAAWQPPERLSPSEWAERYHVIPRGSAEPGAYRLDRTPPLREILDTLGDDQHTEVILCKGVQIGGTTLAQIIVSHWIDSPDADSVLLTLPNMTAAHAYIEERIQPLLDNPRLARYQTGRVYDITKSQLDLVHMSIYSAWTGSPQSMASRAVPKCISDEVDKAQDHSKEAAALDLVRDRALTFGSRAKHFVLSTPTTSVGPIWQAFLATADKRYYHVPCPHCATSQRLVWEQVRWDKKDEEQKEDAQLALAEELLTGAAHAWYECSHCHGRIDEPDRMRMVAAGEWVSVLGPDPVSTRVAYHLSALYSPWVSFGRLVSEYLRASISGDLRNFENSFLALPQQETVEIKAPNVFRERSLLHRPFIVPDWASTLVAGADTQAASKSHPYWYFVVRAYGPQYRSRLISCGRAMSAEELLSQTINARFQVENSNRTVSPMILTIDSGGGAELQDGNTTEAVYRLCRSDPGRLVPIKGHGGRTRPDRLIRTSHIQYTPPGAPTPPFPVLLHILDTESLADRMAALIASTDPILWEESNCLPPEYPDHMTAMEKTRIKVGRGKRLQTRWIKTSHSRCDYWDANLYSLAAAIMVKADERQARAQQAPVRPVPTPSLPGRGPTIDRTKTWISRRR